MNKFEEGFNNIKLYKTCIEDRENEEQIVDKIYTLTNMVDKYKENSIYDSKQGWTTYLTNNF